MSSSVQEITVAHSPDSDDAFMFYGPATFEWTDECYYTDHVNPDIHPLLVTDPARLDDPDKATYPGDRFGNALPLAWYHRFDGGREFYTALGHNKEDYSNPVLYKHILGGILWVLGKD